LQNPVQQQVLYRGCGKRRRGRKPKSADPGIDPDANANATDPDSGIIKTRRGWLQGYNGQIVVTAGQIIIANDVTTHANDVQQLSPMLAQARANVVAVVGESEQDEVTLGAAVADAGYWSEANVATETADCELIIATQKDHKQRGATAARRKTEEHDGTRAHGPQAAHPARTGALSSSRCLRRAGVRADEGSSGCPPLQHARAGTLPRRVELASGRA